MEAVSLVHVKARTLPGPCTQQPGYLGHRQVSLFSEHGVQGTLYLAPLLPQNFMGPAALLSPVAL